MCIAIVKPAGISMPSDEILTRCWEANDDGAGMAYPCKSGVQIIKGFKSLEEFLEFTKSQDFSICNVLLHFRIGTHGDKQAAKHTHPFPIGRTVEEMESTNIVVERALIHNGIMSEFSYDHSISDTMAFCRDAAKQVLALSKLTAGDDMIESILGYNKIAVMEKNGNVKLHGKWIFDAGIHWSNTSYKEDRWSFASCDPRQWGTATTTGVKKYGTIYDYEAEREEWPDATDDVDLAKPNRYGTYWSDFVIELLEKFSDLDSADFKVLEELASKLNIPEGTRERPMGMTFFEWDAWGTWQYLNQKITLEQFFVLNKNLEIQEEE